MESVSAISSGMVVASTSANLPALSPIFEKVPAQFKCDGRIVSLLVSVSEYHCVARGQSGVDMDNVLTEYSGVGRRFGAHVVDFVIVSSVLILHGMAFRMLRAAGIWKVKNAGIVSPDQLWHSFGVAPKIAVLLAFLVTSGLIYFPIFESSAWQATPGKRMLNIFVARDDRTCLGIRAAVGRWLVKWFVGWFGGSLISVGMIAGLANHKAIHDYTAGTIVLKGRPIEQKGIELWRVIAAFGIAFAWLLGTLYTIL